MGKQDCPAVLGEFLLLNNLALLQRLSILSGKPNPITAEPNLNGVGRLEITVASCDVLIRAGSARKVKAARMHSFFDVSRGLHVTIQYILEPVLPKYIVYRCMEP